jgi:ribosome-associated toxin RatA of RatAB toxin-antitoxin module
MAETVSSDKWLGEGEAARRTLQGHLLSSQSDTNLRRGSDHILAERRLTVRRQVAASCDSVWDVLADFPNLADHWDGLKASRAIGDQTHGVGARRQVDLAPVGTLLETVTAWEERRRIDTTNQPSALVPFKQAESRLTLEPNADGTTITFDYQYVPRGGTLGRLTGPVIDTMLRRDFESMLASIEEAALNAG